MKSEVKFEGSTLRLQLKLLFWSKAEVGGMRSVAVKCVDIRQNTGGEGI